MTKRPNRYSSRVALFCAILLSSLTACLATTASAEDQPVRPNILWLTSEDNGAHIGAFGDPYADTPHLDRLARQSLMYVNAWSNAPVCAPARTCIISGVYPPSSGSQHMRSMTRLPDFIQMYPQMLREAGYYCTNNSKEDYNLEKPAQVWDDSSRKAHYKNRRPGQPFFAIFNFTISHESQIRKRPHKPVHDPDQARVPAYHPDTPEVRRDWAQYHDKMTEMDKLVGQKLSELEEAGLADDTIIFYYGDHGSGMPRSKRWPYNSGLNVPLIVHIPEKFKHLRPAEYQPGSKTTRLVSFVDLAPTLLSLIGIEPPDYLQGHAFLGEYETEPQPYIYGFRGRMDERYDMVRTVRDERYIYIRNYMPHKVYGQYIDYMFQTPTTAVWKRLYDEGKLAPPQTFFWETKPAEELYDLQEDPDEVHNLAGSEEHAEILERLRDAQQAWCRDIRDLGFLPEGEIHERSQGTTPYEMGHDPDKYPLEEIMATAELATHSRPGDLRQLAERLGAEDSAVRYWAAMGLLIRGEDAIASQHDALLKALGDPSPYVRVTAAEALGRYGEGDDPAIALAVLLKAAPVDVNGIYVSMTALNALDAMDDRATAAGEQIRKLPQKDDRINGRMRAYVPNLIKKTLRDIEDAQQNGAK